MVMYVACMLHVGMSISVSFYLGQCSLVFLFLCVEYRTLMWLMEVKLLDRFSVLVRCKHVLINWEFSCSL
jgi:hypothetical protein